MGTFSRVRLSVGRQLAVGLPGDRAHYPKRPRRAFRVPGGAAPVDRLHISEGDWVYVSGEVMPAAPDFQDGQIVTAAELENVVHFDGAFMPVDEVRILAWRYLKKRPSFDRNHDGNPRGATALESFVAPANSEVYLPLSWVVTAGVYEQELRESIAAGEDTAYSVQFMVEMTEVTVQLQTSDGLIPIVLTRFSNGDPQYVSFTGNPATLVHWAWTQASERAIPGAVDMAWDAAGATERLMEWATVDTPYGRGLDLRRYSQGFASTEGGVLSDPFMDVVNGTPVIVPRALVDLPRLVDREPQAVARIQRHLFT